MIILIAAPGKYLVNKDHTSVSRKVYLPDDSKTEYEEIDQAQYEAIQKEQEEKYAYYKKLEAEGRIDELKAAAAKDAAADAK